MSTIKLGQHIVGEASSPYIIAEIGVNHEGALDTAFKLIDLAREGGADAAKFQTYKAETIAARLSPSYWDLTKEATTSQFELFKKYDAFGPADYEKLARHCEKVGIDFLSTPFDLDAVDFLNPLMPFFKIASADLTNVPLLRKVAATGKPVVLSTGASTLDEIDKALSCLTEAGAKDVALLHCVLNYPLDYKNAHLNMIQGLQDRYPSRVTGFSDHTPPDSGMLVLLSAYLKGARILEKHFTHNKKLPGNDHYHAMDVHDLRLFRKQLIFVRTLEGDRLKRPLESEDIARRNARRSLVTRGPLRAGQKLCAENIICKRPAVGISPWDYDAVLGRTVTRDLPDDHILTPEDLE